MQVAADDHDTLAMARTAHSGIALDIDNPPPADRCLRRNPRRNTEGIFPHVIDCQAVHLPDNGVRGVDHDRAVEDHLLELLFREPDPLDPFVDRLPDVLVRHDRLTLLGRPVIRLAEDVGDKIKSRRDLVLPSGQPDAVFRHRGDP